MIHQIWLTPNNPLAFSKFNEPAKKLMGDLELLCDQNNIKYKLWTEFDLKEFDLDNLYPKYKNACISDIMRCHILTKYGGMYMDSDLKVLDMKELKKYIVNDNSFVIQTHTEVKYTNHIISVQKGYDFSRFLDNYNIEYGYGVEIFSNFVDTENIKVVEVPLNIIKDYSFNTWKPFKDIRTKVVTID